MQSNEDSPPPYTSQPIPGVHQHYSHYPPTAPPPNIYGHPSYGATRTIIVSEPEIIIIGACPACRIGVLEDNYPCLGLLMAILFFPAGILCCLLMKEKRCSNCGATFG